MGVASPFEIKDFLDGEVLELVVERYEDGVALFKTREMPAGKEIPVIRLHTTPRWKPVGLPYWDLSSKTLRQQLLGVLGPAPGRRAHLKIQAHGLGLGKRFTVSEVPLV